MAMFRHGDSMLLVDPSHSGQRRGRLLLSLTSCSATQVCAGINYFRSSILYKIKNPGEDIAAFLRHRHGMSKESLTVSLNGAIPDGHTYMS
jgi:hypothetical protein